MLGDTIQSARKARGLTLAALAEASGVHKSTLSRWERGKTVPFAQELTKVLDVLGLSPSQRRACYRDIEAPRVIPVATADPDAAGVPISSGEILRVLRIRAALTQADAAHFVGVTQGLVAKWEKSECSPSSEQIYRLCTAYRTMPDEAAFLAHRSWRQFDTLPLDKDALDEIVQYLEYHDTTRERVGLYLTLAARYQALYRKNKISEVEANDIHGYYGGHQSWRLRQYRTAWQIAVPAVNNLAKSRGSLTMGQREAVITHVDYYCRTGQFDEALSLLQGIRDKVGPHQSWWWDYYGTVAEASGNIEYAIRCYHNSVSQAFSERDAGVRRLRTVSMLCRNGRYRDAIRFLAAAPASESRPNVVAATLLNHAWVFAGLGAWNDAIAYYNHADTLMRPHNFDDVNELSANVARLIERR